MSLGLAGITAFLTLRAVHLMRRPTVRLQNLNLKLGGRISGAGWAFALVTTLWLVFTAHSAFVQGHRFAGRRALDRTQASRAEVLDGTFRYRAYTDEHHAAVATSLRHFRAAERWGLAPVQEVELGLAWAHLLQDDVEPALERIRGELDRHPGSGTLRDDLFRILLSRGRDPEAVAVKLQSFERLGASSAERQALATQLAQAGHSEAAIAAYEAALSAGADGIELRYNLGGLLRRESRFEEAIVHLTEAERLAPQDPDTRVELALALHAAGRFDAAVERYLKAIALAPERPEAAVHLPRLIDAARRRQFPPAPNP
jgi:tetratricopeptide (TPR) repeat protein